MIVLHILGRILRLVLGGLFIAAGAIKLRDPSAFAVEIANYQMLPQLAPYLAVVLPPFELVLGLAAFAAPGTWRRAAALGMTALLLVFTAVTASALYRGINIDCGCFGRAGGPISGMTILRDVALLAGAVALFFFERPSSRGLGRAPGLPEAR